MRLPVIASEATQSRGRAEALVVLDCSVASLLAMTMRRLAHDAG
jgi:hypothetical protein